MYFPNFFFIFAKIKIILPMIYKLNNGGVVKLQNAWTTMPSVEDAILKAWANQSAKEKAEKQVASEKPKYTYVNPYDYLHGWREATEDAAKQDKYTVENLSGSKEEAEAAYNATKENAAKQLAGTTATGLGTVALLGLSSGAAGPVAADIVNTGFGAHGLYNALSGNGIQKTVRLANQGDIWGTVKSGAGDLLDLSMGLHAAKLWGNLGKSMLAGQSLGNAYRGNIAGRELSNGVKRLTIPVTDLQRNIEAGKIGWAPAATKTLWHNSNDLVSELKINFPAWDVTERKAPLGHVWLTGNETTQGFLAKRPHHLKGKVELNKPMVQIGEAIGDGKNTTRNQILDFAQKSSADGINFQGITDNTLQNQDVYAAFKDVTIPQKSMSFIDTQGDPLLYVNRAQDAVNDIKTGRALALNYLGSDTKQQIDLHNKAILNRILESAPEEKAELLIETDPLSRAATPMVKPTAVGYYPEYLDAQWIGSNSDGFFIHRFPNNKAGEVIIEDSPMLDQLYLNPNYNLKDSALHEYLHRGRIGYASNLKGKWLYNWKTGKLLKDDYSGYLRDPQEAGVNLLEIGKRNNVQEKYPGPEKAKEIIKSIIEKDYKGEMLDATRWETKPKRVWDALNGRYLAATPLLPHILKLKNNERVKRTSETN